ncbi:glycosyltransferase family 4 protein [Psychrobacter sp. CAL346-MNA-CIBAN-0220]|uniref:glycosyltransferase family 4 protein n=1 Tax=Psychrobacter sp. CAL346-MNA-CIBAN-0220 TaxID=3140457 RepID=UPI00332E0DFA
MKKICFLIGDLNNCGGTERVTSLIADKLVKKNFNVSILSLTDGMSPFFALDNDIQTYSLYSKNISFKKNFIGVIWKIRQFVQQNKIDTLIVVDSISCMFTVPALYGLEVNHICWEHFNFNVNLGVKARDLGRKWAAKHCDYIVTLTKRDKELWEEGLKNIKAEIIPIANPTPYENIEHTPSLEFKTVLALGRLTYQKGFDFLIEAWAQVCQTNDDWTLRIVGSGENEESLKTQARKLKISGRIDFVPATKKVEQYYKTSSFYCLSSRFEGFGMVLLEAQAFGLPIVAFDCDCGPRDLIEDGKSGWLSENGNVEDLAKKLSKVTELDELDYLQLSSNAKKSSLEFSTDKISKIWVNIL